MKEREREREREREKSMSRQNLKKTIPEGVNFLSILVRRNDLQRYRLEKTRTRKEQK